MNIKLLTCTLLIVSFSIFVLPASGKMTLEEKIRLLQNEIIKENSNSPDINILKNYSKSIESLNKTEKVFLVEVINLIKEFRGKPLDTQVETIGDINGNGVKDKIVSRIHAHNGNVKVTSIWIKNNKTLWEYTLENPYLWIGPSDLFQFDTRDIWVVFTIALKHTVPKVIEPSDYKISRDWIVKEGVKALAGIGINTTKQSYANYLKSFSGKLLQYGEPESGGLLDIWYSPVERFIPYYRP